MTKSSSMRRNAGTARRQPTTDDVEVGSPSKAEAPTGRLLPQARRRRKRPTIIQQLRKDPKAAQVAYVLAAAVLAMILVVTVVCSRVLPDGMENFPPRTRDGGAGSSRTIAVPFPSSTSRIWRRNDRQNANQIQLDMELTSKFRLLMPAAGASPLMFQNPPQVTFPDIELLPDYNDLQFQFLAERGVARTIFYDFREDVTDFHDPDTNDDDMEWYYAFDDDYKRSEYTAAHYEDGKPGTKTCRRTADHRLNFQTCNQAHELDLLENEAHYLAHGAYRQVMRVDRKYLDTKERIIMKDIRNDYDIEYDHFEYVRMDGIVAERLTRHPAIFDIYGMCGLSIISEFFPHGDMETYTVPTGGYIRQEALDREPDLRPRNNLTAMEKLSIATQMAEALALLHNFEHGVIVHDDVQPAQFLYNADKSVLKLNDFNRAEFMLWDDENGMYCKYQNGDAHGAWRAPEEYKDDPLNEKIDVFSLGNNIYSIMTGLWPFYVTRDDASTRKRLVAGELQPIDPRYKERSEAEATLVEVIEKCWIYDPDERPSMTEIGQILRSKLDELEKKI